MLNDYRSLQYYLAYLIFCEVAVLPQSSFSRFRAGYSLQCPTSVKIYIYILRYNTCIIII